MRYRNESFYTVTALPLYVHRRRFLIARIEQVLGRLAVASGVRALDFGCGDGFYVEWLARFLSKAKVVGYDPSPAMIQLAHARHIVTNERVELTTNVDEAIRQGPYDIILVFAVLAHITNDEDLVEMAQLLRSSLKDKGMVIVFEQTGGQRREGPGWTRRPPNDYVKLFSDAGLSLFASDGISYPQFVRFDPWLRALWSVGRGLRKARGRSVDPNPNSSPVYRFASRVAFGLSRRKRGPVQETGNSLYFFGAHPKPGVAI